MVKGAYKLPPGRRGWPVIGDSFNWYNAVASSHPPQFVEEQVKRYKKNIVVLSSISQLQHNKRNMLDKVSLNWKINLVFSSS